MVWASIAFQTEKEAVFSHIEKRDIRHGASCEETVNCKYTYRLTRVYNVSINDKAREQRTRLPDTGI